MTAAVKHIEPEDTKVMDVTELLALFDAAFTVGGVWVTVFESRSPGAEYSARLWASSKNLKIEVATTVCEGGATFQVVHVRKGVEAIISIHRDGAKP